MLRRIRAALMTALTWCVLWSIWGALVGGVGVALDLTFPIPFREFTFVNLVARSAIVGALGGLVFAGILAVILRRKSLDQVNADRLTTLGTLGGLVVPVIAGIVTIEKPGLPITDAEIVSASLLLFVAPGLMTSYGTLRLALARPSAPQA